MKNPLLIMDEPITTDGISYASEFAWLGFGAQLLARLGGGVLWTPLRNGSIANLRNRFEIDKNVKVAGSGYYESFKQFYLLNPLKRFQLNRGLTKAIESSSCVIVRAPSQMASLITKECKRRHRPLITIYAGDFLAAASPLQARGFRRLLLAPIATLIDSYQRILGESSNGVISIGDSILLRYHLEHRPHLITSDATISAEDISGGRKRSLNVNAPLRLIRLASYLENKNYELLFSTITKLRTMGWNGQTDCYGLIKDESYFQKLQSLCPEGVYLHPPLRAGSEVQDKLKQSDLQIVCSKSEGVPRTLLEGAAAGVALVAVPVGGIPSVVVDGRTALFAVGKDQNFLAEELALKISSLDKDRNLLHKLVQQGYELAEGATREKKIAEMVDFIRKYSLP